MSTNRSSLFINANQRLSLRSNADPHCNSQINSQRNVERISTPKNSQPAVQRISMLINPQPVPVRVTNRNNQKSPIYNQNTASSSYQQKRILIIGSSILKGINYRGLRKGVKICSRPGARVPDLLEELSIYDLKSFEKSSFV